jgi:dipeptidyl aminopeptidase/acylaminoacyl peptidase
MAQLRAAHARAVRCLDDALPHLDPPGERVEIPFEGSKMVGVRPTEQLFLDRGLATFTLDGPGQGEAEYDLPIRPDWEIPGAAVIDVVEARPEIDGERIGVWGVSLGGYYAPRVASGDKRVRACVLCRGRSRSARSGTSSPRSRGRRSRRGLDHQATKRPATARSN